MSAHKRSHSSPSNHFFFFFLPHVAQGRLFVYLFVAHHASVFKGVLWSQILLRLICNLVKWKADKPFLLLFCSTAHGLLLLSPFSVCLPVGNTNSVLWPSTHTQPHEFSPRWQNQRTAFRQAHVHYWFVSSPSSSTIRFIDLKYWILV